MTKTPNLVELEQSQVVAPPPREGTIAELSLPLTFFDTKWWNFLPMHDLLFYKFAHPTTHFVEHILPNLKSSLSLALKHFLPLAGNLICPFPDSGRLGLCYQVGDSINLTLAESLDDFNDLVGNHPRNANRFYPFVPQLPPSSVDSSGNTKTPLFAVQVTIFPNSGICIGWSFRHVVGDGRSIVGFLKAWGSIHKFGGNDKEFLASNSLPYYDRSAIQDPFNFDTLIFNAIKFIKPQESSPVTTMETDKVRATFDISKSDIQKLKDLVTRANLGKEAAAEVHISSFTVTCAYVWTCWLRSMDAVGDQKADDINETEYFDCLVDFRTRLDPKIPVNYFGNCVLPCFAESKHDLLVGKNGFVNAAIIIGEAIQRKVNDKDGVSRGDWLSEMKKVAGKRVFAVAGSPKYDVYGVDFGFGKPEKHETIAIDVTGAMLLNKSRKYEGGLEISLALSKDRMDAFTNFFADGLKNL